MKAVTSIRRILSRDDELASPLEHGEGELAPLVDAIRAAYVHPPAAGTAAEHLYLIEEASSEQTAAAVPVLDRPLRRPRRARAAKAAAIGLAVPLLSAGLATAGVKLPGPVDSAFQRIGVELPNQGRSDDRSEADRNGHETPPASTGGAGPTGDQASPSGAASRSGASGERGGSSSDEPRGKGPGAQGSPTGRSEPSAGAPGSAGGPPQAGSGGPPSSSPGASGAAPGKAGSAPGRSGAAPGRSKTRGPDAAPGRSGAAPGKGGTAPGKSGEAPGKSGESAGKPKAKQ